MTRNRLTRFTPRCLELEPRDVPAGNVSATLAGDVLVVAGDAADNNVILRGKGPGVVELQGAGTTINGSAARLTFGEVIAIDADLSDGNDIVTSNDLELGGISIYAGTGDDGVHLNGTTGTADGLGIAVYGDYSPSTPDGANGEDTIR